jgi:hypothetical protein
MFASGLSVVVTVWTLLGLKLNSYALPPEVVNRLIGPGSMSVAFGTVYGVLCIV